MVRWLYDPADLMSTLETPENVRAMSFAGAGFEAANTYFASRAAVKETKAARSAERISLSRQLRDEGRDTSLALARTRALMAASGIGSDGVNVLASGAAERGRRAMRLRLDSEYRQRQLSVRADNQRRAGVSGAIQALVGGAVEGQTLYSRLAKE